MSRRADILAALQRLSSKRVPDRDAKIEHAADVLLEAEDMIVAAPTAFDVPDEFSELVWIVRESLVALGVISTQQLGTPTFEDGQYFTEEVIRESWNAVGAYCFLQQIVWPVTDWPEGIEYHHGQDPDDRIAEAYPADIDAGRVDPDNHDDVIAWMRANGAAHQIDQYRKINGLVDDKPRQLTRRTLPVSKLRELDHAED
jgi:hypothetical protein